MTEATHHHVFTDTSQQQRAGMRVAKPVRRPIGGHRASEVSLHGGDEVVDGLRPQRRQPLTAVQVDEYPPVLQIYGAVGVGVAELPDVLAVQPLQLVTDVDLPVTAVLRPNSGGMILAGHYLNKRRATLSDVPVAVPQR